MATISRGQRKYLQFVHILLLRTLFGVRLFNKSTSKNVVGRGLVEVGEGKQVFYWDILKTPFIAGIDVLTYAKKFTYLFL